jgi:hypothetical protein
MTTQTLTDDELKCAETIFKHEGNYALAFAITELRASRKARAKVRTELNIIASGTLRDGSVVDGSVVMAVEETLADPDVKAWLGDT